MKEKVSKYKFKIERNKANSEQWAIREFDVKRKIVAHSREIDVTRTWVHVDMDMFYAAVSLYLHLACFKLIITSCRLKLETILSSKESL